MEFTFHDSNVILELVPRSDFMYIQQFYGRHHDMVDHYEI